MMNKSKVVFFGTSEFALPALKTLHASDEVELVAIITETDKPAGRKLELKKSPVKIFAEEKGLLLLQPEKLDKNFSEKIKKLNPDVAVLVAYGKKIPKDLLKIPEKGFINVHPSLLPKYRGASPVQTAILNGDKKTGVTIFVLDEKIDRGPILAQKPYEMKGNETTPELEEKLSLLGAEILIPTIKKYIGGELEPQKQNENEATLTKQFSREDGKIDFKKSAEEIEKMVRAFYPWPGAWAEIKNIGRIKITKASALSFPPSICHSERGEESRGRPKGDPRPTLSFSDLIGESSKLKKIPVGNFFEFDGKLAVKCGHAERAQSHAQRGGKDALLIEKLVPEGKKEMTGEEFLRGHRDLTKILHLIKISVE